MECRKDSKRKDSDADVDEMETDVNEGKNLKRKVEETVSESSIEELEENRLLNDDGNSDETDAEISSDIERMALSDSEDEPGDNKGNVHVYYCVRGCLYMIPIKTCAVKYFSLGGGRFLFGPVGGPNPLANPTPPP